MGKRCQVCDGPVVNGRCKYCGMPYRNDMELYHLNEDRSEHYRHASAKVKKVMAESEIPLPDRNKTASKAGKTAAARTQTARTQNTKARTSRTYSTGQKTVSGEKKKTGRAGKIFWIIVMILMVVAGQTVEHWDTIGYQIEDFVSEKLNIDLGSFFEDSSADEVNENDWMDKWTEAVDSAKNGQDDLENEPYYYIFSGEDYVIGQKYIITENGDTEDLEYELTIEPGEYILESGWGEEIVLEIKSSSGKDKTVKFDEAGHQETVELHAGDEVSAACADSQDNYLVMYQIQQYDE